MTITIIGKSQGRVEIFYRFKTASAAVSKSESMIYNVSIMHTEFQEKNLCREINVTLVLKNLERKRLQKENNPENDNWGNALRF